MEGVQNEMKHSKVCKKDFHRSLFAKHLRSKLHEDNENLISSNFSNGP